MKLSVPPQHWRWLQFCVAGLLLLGTQPWIEEACSWAHDRGQALAEDYEQAQQAAQRFQDDVQLAQQAGGQISQPDMDRLLAPVDRMRAAAQLERYAASARLSHYSYVLAPARPAKIDSVDAKDLIANDLSFEADVPHDLDAIGFLRNLDYILPGQIHLRRLVLSRAADNQTLNLTNLHLAADVTWLSNGAAP